LNRKLNSLAVLLVCSLVVLALPAKARETYRQLKARMASAGLQVERPDLESQLFQLANQYRKSRGLRGLVLNQPLHDASLAHAMDMMQHNYMGHVASTGHDFDSRMRALRDGAMNLPSMGENAARLSHSDLNDTQAAQKIFQQWLNSPPHRHTLASRDYVSVATGVVAQGDKIYADQIFVGPEVVTNVGRALPEQADGNLY
jgi:uncharacterized protein YkwD